MTKLKLADASKEEIKTFRDVVPGINFFTRNIHSYLSTDKYIIELSSSSLSGYENLYGITVVEKLPEGIYMRRDDISTAKHSFEEVVEYLNNLKDETVCQDSKGNS